MLLPQPSQSCLGTPDMDPPQRPTGLTSFPLSPSLPESSRGPCRPFLFTGTQSSLGKGGHSRGQALHSSESSSTEPHTADSHSGPAPNPAVTFTPNLSSCAAPCSQLQGLLLFLTIIMVPNTLNNNLRASIPTHAHTHTHTHTYLQPSLLIYQLWSKVPAVATVPTQVQAILKNTKFPLLKVF